MIYHIILVIFRITIIERSDSTKLLYVSVPEKELLNRTVLSDFKLVCCTAMILFIAGKHEFQIASHHSLD